MLCPLSIFKVYQAEEVFFEFSFELSLCFWNVREGGREGSDLLLLSGSVLNAPLAASLRPFCFNVFISSLFLIFLRQQLDSAFSTYS